MRKFLNGFTIDNDGKLKQTAKRVATLKSSHFDYTDAQPSQEFEINHTFSENIFEQMKQGVDVNSLSLDNSYFDGREVNKTVGHEEYSASNSTFTLYSIGRILCKQKQIQLHSSQLNMDSSFMSWTVNAISSGLVNIQSAENLVKILNQYGWYLPIEYVVGGAKLEIQNKTVKNNDDVESAINAFTSKFPRSSAELQTTAKVSERNESSDSHYEFIGGIASENDTMFIRSLNDPNNWAIIEYVEFLPTLKLLHDRNPFLFGHCIKLLVEFHSHRTIKDLQRYINIHDYAMKLELRRLVV